MSTIQGTSSASYAAQLQYLQSLQQTNQDPLVQQSGSDPMSFGLDPFTSNASQTQSSGGSSGPPFSLGAMSALIDAQEQSSSSASGLSNQQQKVFNELDTDGDGTVTKSELEKDFGSGSTQLADKVFAKLDTNGDGSISQGEFGAGTTKTMHHHHHMMAPQDGSQDAQSADGAQSGQTAQDPLSQLLNASGANGASSTSTSNSDGSTTTTITYADGSKVTMTSAATATSSDSSSTSSNSSSSSNANSTQQNLLEQLIKMQAQMIQQMAGSATSSLATV